MKYSSEIFAFWDNRPVAICFIATSKFTNCYKLKILFSKLGKYMLFSINFTWNGGSRDHMVVRFMTTYAISVDHH